ncbi:MAG: hypothetical protein ACHQF2_08305 [Flavobacteriales bacterium]
MYRNAVLLFTLALVNYGGVYAQASNVSPYSRYGLGDIYDLQFAQNTGMGGTSISFADSFLINIANPASYGQLARFNPVLDVGARGRLIRFYTNADSAKNYALSLSNIAMAIPVSKRVGLAFGLVPYSSSGYDITYNVTDDTLGNVRYAYQGNGGINRAFIGAAYSPLRNSKSSLSLGVNASYLFGEIQKVRKVYYLSLGTGTYNTKIINSYFVHDVALDAGLLYKNTLIDKRLIFRLGVTYGVPLDITATQTMLAHTFTSTLSESIIDTVAYEDDVKGHFSLPVKWGYAMSFDVFGKRENNPPKFTFALQYEMQSWEKFEENFGQAVKYDFLNNSSAMSFGFQYIPRTIGNGKSRIKTLALANYRAGVYQKKSYLTLQNSQIIEQGVTFGIGLPLIYSYSYSMLNISFELGTRGTTDNNLILERYFGVHIGYAFSPNKQSDRWFVKRRFD